VAHTPKTTLRIFGIETNGIYTNCNNKIIIIDVSMSKFIGESNNDFKPPAALIIEKGVAKAIYPHESEYPILSTKKEEFPIDFPLN
jgi:hypothetical protein